jgi:ATP-dependent DNA ligase
MAIAARRDLPRRRKVHARRTNPLPAPGMAQSGAHRPHAGPRALPEWIRPQLTQLVEAAPDGDQWLHEIKYDGFRMHARLDRGALRPLTRNGLDSHGVLKSRGLDRPFFVFQIRSLSPL